MALVRCALREIPQEKIGVQKRSEAIRHPTPSPIPLLHHSRFEPRDPHPRDIMDPAFVVIGNHRPVIAGEGLERRAVVHHELLGLRRSYPNGALTSCHLRRIRPHPYHVGNGICAFRRRPGQPRVWDVDPERIGQMLRLHFRYEVSPLRE